MATVDSPASDAFLRGAYSWQRSTGGSSSTNRSRRTELELVAEVLLCLDRGIVQTSAILRRANLTYARLAVILSQLEVRKLIRRERENGHSQYFIEPRGREFLSEFRNFQSLMVRTYGFSL